MGWAGLETLVSEMIWNKLSVIQCQVTYPVVAIGLVTLNEDQATVQSTPSRGGKRRCGAATENPALLSVDHDDMLERDQRRTPLIMCLSLRPP